MTAQLLWLLVAIAISPLIAWGTYRLSKELGFLDPPVDKQHELRRTIIVSLYCFLLLLPALLFGFARGWPRIWILFGAVNLLVLGFFGFAGVISVLRLWRLRHPEPSEPEILPAVADSDIGPMDLPLDSQRDEEGHLDEPAPRAD
jgi:hypothetical protein